MPSTANNLWPALIDFENIYKAYRMAARGKRYRGDVLNFASQMEDNLFSIVEDLQSGVYAPSPLRQFLITDPKPRLISAPAFRDRVVHHAIVQIIEPVFERRFLGDSFACRKGRGTHAAMRHMSNCARRARRRWGDYYFLKCDVSKFFPSIRHDVLLGLLRRAIRDKRLLGLLDTVVRSHESEPQTGIGLPIGALTSQLFANIYLDPLDHWLRESCGVKYYARYMDDFVILHHDKVFLRGLWDEIAQFLNEKLWLRLNQKTAIQPGRHGIDFCGYRIWPAYVKPRKRTIKRAKKRFKKMLEVYKDNPETMEHARMSIMSFLGYTKHCSARRTTSSILRRTTFRRRAVLTADNGQEPSRVDR